MRVAYLINQYPKTSHTFIRREILALERQGLDVLRIAVRGWDTDVPDPDDRLEQKRTTYILSGGPVKLLCHAILTILLKPVRFCRAFAISFSMLRRSDRPFFVHFAYLAEACMIQRLLAARRVEHLHAHFGTNSAEVAMLTHALGGPPWSFTVHGPEEFDKAQIMGLAYKIRSCAFAVAISSFGRSQLYRLVDHSLWPKIHVVRCGIEKSYLGRTSDPAPAAKRFVCVGRLCEQKGQLLLLDAAQRLLKRGTQFRLVFAGDGEMRTEIERLILAHELENVVRITGWISSDRVREEILAARALVLPSFAEGLPVAIMEAMALGRPVISTFVAGIPELVDAGNNGWLVPAGDAELLATAIQACLDEPLSSLTCKGKAARERVSRQHDVDNEAAKLKELFAAASVFDASLRAEATSPTS